MIIIKENDYYCVFFFFLWKTIFKHPSIIEIQFKKKYKQRKTVLKIIFNVHVLLIIMLVYCIKKKITNKKNTI